MTLKIYASCVNDTEFSRTEHATIAMLGPATDFDYNEQFATKLY